MGLDTSLYKSKKLSSAEKIMKVLCEESEREAVAYWRKDWALVELFGNVLGEEIENCGSYEVTKEQLIEINKKLNDKQISKVIKKTDWDKEVITFHNWW